MSGEDKILRQEHFFSVGLYHQQHHGTLLACLLSPLVTASCPNAPSSVRGSYCIFLMLTFSKIADSFLIKNKQFPVCL